jgi:hypothetical protein
LYIKKVERYVPASFFKEKFKQKDTKRENILEKLIK